MTTQYKKNTIVAIMLVSTLMISGSSVLAQTPTGTQKHPNFFQGFVEMISQKFGLDKGKVQTEVNDYKDKKFTEMEKNREDRESKRLDQLVKDGKLNESQKTALLAEFSALKKKYIPSDSQTQTQEQRRDQFEAMKAEFETWAKSNGIDASILRTGPVRGMMMSLRGRLRAPGQRSK